MERHPADPGRAKKPEKDGGRLREGVSEPPITGIYVHPDTGMSLVARDANSFFSSGDDDSPLRSQSPSKQARQSGGVSSKRHRPDRTI